MLQWFKQMSVIARLRGLALVAVVTMLALSSSLLWTSYKQRLADRQIAASQRVELAHASVQWAYARQQFGKLNATQARAHTMEVLDRMKRGKPMIEPSDDVHMAMLSQTAVTLGAVLLVSLLLWVCIEVTARDLGSADARRAASERRRETARGPQAYRQGPLPPALTAMHQAAAQQSATPPRSPSHAQPVSLSSDADDGLDDPNEAAAQEVKRLRMAGAI